MCYRSLAATQTPSWFVLVSGLLLIGLGGPVEARSAGTFPPTGADGAADLVMTLAPNPLRLGLNGTTTRLRIEARDAGVTIEGVEVYSMAGELLRTLSPDEMGFSDAYVPAGAAPVAEAWWDLRTEAGVPVATGVYWVRLLARPDAAGGGAGSLVTRVAKFILVR